MKLIIADSYSEMSELAGDILLSYIVEERAQHISITAGKTPELMYKMLVPKINGLNFNIKAKFYNFDEIPYKKTKREGITISDLRDYFFTPANIPEENIHVLDQNNYKSHDKLIKDRGGLDLMIIGIGADGHYCGNLPNTTKFFDETSKVFMPDPMRMRVGRLHFKDPEEYPDYYITMGPRSVMKVKKLVLIANGEKKADIIKRTLEGPVSSEIPASILPLHTNITVIIDKESASKLSAETIEKYR